MSRVFVAASSNVIKVPLRFGGANKASVSFWAYFPSYTSGDAKMIYESNDGAINSINTLYCYPSRFSNSPVGAGDKFCVGMAGGGFFEDYIPRPSAAVWHHVLITHDRATPLHRVWIDGVEQTLTAIAHGLSNAAFTDSTMTFGKYSTTYLDMTIADWAIWNGVLFAQGEASVLSKYVSPLNVRPDRLLAYLPFDGAAANREPVYGRMGDLSPALTTLTGTTGAAHPFGQRTIVRPRRRTPVRA